MIRQRSITYSGAPGFSLAQTTCTVTRSTFPSSPTPLSPFLFSRNPLRTFPFYPFFTWPAFLILPFLCPSGLRCIFSRFECKNQFRESCLIEFDSTTTGKTWGWGMIYTMAKVFSKLFLPFSVLPPFHFPYCC